MTAALILTVQRIPKAQRVTVEGVEMAWRWTVAKAGRNDPQATFTSGCPTKRAAVDHARNLAAAHGYTPDQIEERIA